MMILDANGRPAVSGTSPRGNIGIPESAQETSYFDWMLRATAQRLTDEEITTLVSGLNKDKRLSQTFRTLTDTRRHPLNARTQTRSH